MLQVIGLQKSFDRFMAVREANLEVNQGELVAVIGPNGAGKTTLFKLITGQLKPDRGKIFFKGADLAGRPAHYICRQGIGLSYQVVNLFHRLTVFENVRVAVLSQQKMLYRLFTPAARLVNRETEEILRGVGLEEKANVISGTLSHGDQKVLEIALALGTKPELLILDEPTAGMSPEETRTTMEMIRGLNRQLGLTILFCEHDMELVFSLADRIMVMQQGISLIQDQCNIVKCDQRVIEAYLGSGVDA